MATPITTTERDADNITALLTWQRKSGSAEEKKFVESFIEPLLKHPNTTFNKRDTYGNIFIEVCGGSKTIFTAHTDSVVIPGSKQAVLYDTNIMLAYTDGGCTLGSDDAAGMWMLMELLDAGVPCWLAFFRDEEVGGLGSNHAAKYDSKWFEQFEHCVSFDRRGTEDVITHQGMGRCCSNTFAQALSDALNEHGHYYKPCDGGVFTDSANFTDLIAECTNLSVGYYSEHTAQEELDIEHLIKLRDAVLSIDWASLPVERKPGEKDHKYAYLDRVSLYRVPRTYSTHVEYTSDDIYDMSLEEMREAMEDHPDAMADAIWSLLWSAEDNLIDFRLEDM